MPFGLQAKHFLDALNDVAIIFPVLLIILTWRGFIKAATATLMGDHTAKEEGFLTLNPLVHVDLTGLMTVILIYFFVGGLFYDLIPRAVLWIMLIMLGVRWTIPQPLDDSRFKKYRLGGVLTSLAGPLSNFSLALFFVPLLKLAFHPSLPVYAMITLKNIFSTLIDICLFFGVLNIIIPIPPFDMGRALRYVLPYSSQQVLDWLEEHLFFILLIIFFVPGISDMFFGGVFLTAGVIKKLMLRLFF